MSLLEELVSLFDDNNKSKVKTYDLNTEEGYNEYMKTINEIKNNEKTKSLFKLLDIDIDNLLNYFENTGSNIYKINKKKLNKDNRKKDNYKKDNYKVNKIERKEVDHSIEDKDDNAKFTRPSELLSIDQKLQLHKIVQEYIDTMIKPFNNGVLTVNQINDAYAGLYEFAAWVMNR